MMPTRPAMQGMRARALLLAVVAGIAFGIVGMHGLTLTHSHGSGASATAMPAHSASAQAMSSPVADGGSHGGHDAPGHGDNCDLIACCLAVLFGGALLLWAVLARRHQRSVAWIRRESTILRTHVVSVLRPPPNLHSLSILRC